MLLFEFDTRCLSKVQIDRLNFPFSSIYTKLFAVFDKSIISQCQYYTGQIPLKHLLHLKFLNFLIGLKNIKNSPAKLLFDWFGVNERESIAVQYDIYPNDNAVVCQNKIWHAFKKLTV